MTEKGVLGNTEIGGASGSAPSAPQTRVFTSKYGYTVRYIGHGLYLLKERDGEETVQPLWMLVDYISVVYGEEDVKALKEELGVDE